MPPFKRGALIVIEGVDRSGKSTQCKELVKSLLAKNVNAKLMNFPDRTTPIGGLISEYLKDKNNSLCDEAIHLLFSANRWESRDKMQKLLSSGVTLVLDRYSYSGIVYSSIKKSMNEDWCKLPENGLLKPDLVFLLTLSQEEIASRPGYGNERYENEETQRKVASAFLEMSQQENNWEVVSANREISELQKILLDKVLDTVHQVGEAPFRYLHFKNSNDV